jgi:hypothetical protein
MDPPAPSPATVAASRAHLTERYASGVDRLLWDAEKRLMPNLDAVRSVIRAAPPAQAGALDISASLVLLQAARLELDRLEHEVFEAAHEAGMNVETLAAALAQGEVRAALLTGRSGLAAACRLTPAGGNRAERLRVTRPVPGRCARREVARCRLRIVMGVWWGGPLSCERGQPGPVNCPRC